MFRKTTKRQGKITMKKILGLVFVGIVIFGAFSLIYAKKSNDDFNYWCSKGIDSLVPDEKIKYFTKAIELNPKSAIAYIYRGEVYRIIDRYDLAIEDYSKAIELEPGNADYYSCRGYWYSKSGNYELAINDLSKAIELNSANANYHSNRGWWYFNSGKYELAINDFSKAIELDPESDSDYVNRGWIYLWTEQWEEAKLDFEKAIQLEPNDAAAYCNIGIYYWKAKNDKEKAIEYYEKGFKNGYNFYELYKDDSDGHFIKDLVQTSEFKTLLAKYLNKETETLIKFENSLPNALEEATEQQKPIMIDFFTNWCGWCKKLDRDTYNNSEVYQASKQFINVKINADKEKEITKKYKVTGYPTIVFLDSNGKEIDRVEGYIQPEELLAKLKKINKND